MSSVTAEALAASTFSTWQTTIYQGDLTQRAGDEYGPETVARRNAELREIILAAEQRDSAAHEFAVIGAKKSSLNILQWQHPAIDWLRRRIVEAITDQVRANLGDEAAGAVKGYEVLAEGWAVVYRSGGSHRQHTHHDSVWSGVYYIETGGVGAAGEDAGCLQLLDPRPGAIARGVSPGIEMIKPTPGLLVAFPSWAPHSVRSTLHGDALRICIAFNAAYNKEEGPR
ncbi:putative 2OG-Fe(II) oxygenase [Kitasatospora sp. NPDC094016]|uniref:putative 2OG-Fe(II) oxygenase n=1 Tax=Kitasatospora sp. NPDC094016 TaxID=3154986 RepID=UPI00331C7658